ncbi:MAG: VTT domain-containing protein [Eggerthellaceae bacterium]|nr:VTT domain-containing protein [Eggerthellaceae bacterium]
MQGLIDTVVQFFKNPQIAINSWIDFFQGTFGVVFGSILMYCPLFIIIFIETGVVFFPFLPGDSLLFAAGILSADGWKLNIFVTLAIFYAAAILGNTSNYLIAKNFGLRIIKSGKLKGFTPERMDKLDYFFDKYGSMTIIFTRFMPFVRTFAPFTAGMGKMNFRNFTLFNCIGGIIWISLFVLAGYFFGGFPFVQKNLSLIVILMIGISGLPATLGAITAAIKTIRAKKEPPKKIEFEKENKEICEKKESK